MESIKITAIRTCIDKCNTLSQIANNLRDELRGVSYASRHISRTKNLISVYEDVRLWLCTNYNDTGMQLPFVKQINSAYSLDELIPQIESILIGCLSVKNALSGLIQVKANPEFIDKLSSIRKELKILESKNCDLLIIKDLNASIIEAEYSHYLAAAMISARVIQHIISKIPGNNDKEKMQYLIDKQYTSQDRKDDQEQLLTVWRLSRNYLSHRVGLNPEPSEALIIIGGAFKLARLYPDTQ